MSDRDCEKCKHHTEKGCDSWDCKFEPCDDAISRQAVLNVITEQERLASDRVRDTPSSLGNGLHTWINPVYTRYSAQLSERSQFKTMIQTMPPVTPQPKTGHWIMSEDGLYRPICDKCGAHPWKGYIPTVEEATEVFKYCPNCGARMKKVRIRNEDRTWI